MKDEIARPAPGAREKNGSREPYEAPEVVYTEISVQEALMGICKGGLGAGPYGPGCPGNCRGGGS